MELKVCVGCGKLATDKNNPYCYNCIRDRRNRLFHGRYSRQQAFKFGLFDEDGFLTFDGLDDHRKFGCC